MPPQLRRTLLGLLDRPHDFEIRKHEHCLMCGVVRYAAVAPIQDRDFVALCERADTRNAACDVAIGVFWCG